MSAIVSAPPERSSGARAESLATEQGRLLELVATGQPLAHCLRALCGSVASLCPGAHAAVLLTNAAKSEISSVFSADIALSFGEAIRGAPVNEVQFGTCGTAIHEGRTVTCPDIPAGDGWAPAWRNLCVSHGLRACHSRPIFDGRGVTIGSFAMFFEDPHEPDAWELRISEFGARIASIALQHDRAVASLRDSEERLQAELSDTRLLQAIGTELIHASDPSVLYERIVDAAVALMRSDFASLQMLHADRGAGPRLRLLAHRGFDARAAAFWTWVQADSDSVCGAVLREGSRTVVADIEQCAATAGTEDEAIFRATGIRAVQSTPLFARDGDLVGMLSTHWRTVHQPSERELRLLDLLARQAADLIERARDQDALREADRRKDEFLATLAHELRNPLAPLRNCLHILGMEGADQVDRRQLHEVMERQVGQLVRLVDDLLDVSRITRGKVRLRLEPTTLAEVVARAVETSRPAIDAAGHRLDVDLPSAPLALHGDPVRLAQVFSNLLNNAAKYTEPGGRIALAARREDGDAVVSVRDNGIGIDAGEQERIFELFNQDNRSLTRAQGGLGIGLTLVRSLVEQHGGTVRVQSDGPGRGSEFVVRLPLH